MAAASSEQLTVIGDAVRALVAHDATRLRVIAGDIGDLYAWTRDYGQHGTVELVVPPGAPATWAIDITDVIDGTKHVVVGMWTRQEGRSDLSLELQLAEHTGGWTARVLGLHVL